MKKRALVEQKKVRDDVLCLTTKSLNFRYDKTINIKSNDFMNYH